MYSNGFDERLHINTVILIKNNTTMNHIAPLTEEDMGELI
jgi:hypothetical protein